MSTKSQVLLRITAAVLLLVATEALQQAAPQAKADTPNAIQAKPPVGKWEEVREVTVDGKKEFRNRIREFRPDGTLVLMFVKTGKEVKGTWKRDGDRISFSLPARDDAKAENNLFTIVEANDATMTILMAGERRYAWSRLDQAKPAQEERKDDLTLLQGKWRTILKVGPKGKQFAKDDPRHKQLLEVDGNKLQLTVQQPDAKPLSGTFKLTPTDSPKSFDLSGTGPLGFEIELHGIYELSDDTFRLSVVQCGKEKPYTRPLEFTGPQGGDYFVFKKVVPPSADTPLPLNGEKKVLTLSPGTQVSTRSVALSDDSAMLAVPDANKKVRLINLKTGEETRDLALSGGSVSCLRFSPDGKLLATGTETGNAQEAGTIEIWDVATGKPRIALKGHLSGIESLAFSANGLVLASASTPRLQGPGKDPLVEVKIWDLASGRDLRTFHGHKAKVLSLTFLSDTTVLSVGSDNLANMWDVTDGSLAFCFRGCKNPAGLGLTSLCLTADKAKLVSVAFWDERLQIKRMDIASRKEAYQVVTRFRPHGDAKLTVSPDGLTVAFAARTGSAALYQGPWKNEIFTSEKVNHQTYRDSSIPTFSPDGKRFCVRVKNGVAVWNVADKIEKIGQFDFTSTWNKPPSAAFSNKGDFLIVQVGASVVLWDITGSKLGTEVISKIASAERTRKELAERTEQERRAAIVKERTEAIERARKDKDYLPPLRLVQAVEILDDVSALLGQPVQVERNSMDKRGYLFIWNRGKGGYAAIYFVDAGGVLIRGGIFEYGANRQQVDQWIRFMKGQGPAPTP